MKILTKTAENLGRIHFIGIGGIGMSGLAEVLHAKGFEVSGSDQAAGGNVARLQGLGVLVHIGHAAEHVVGAGVVVLSSAITADNVERAAAETHGAQVVHRADILAEIMQNFKTIAVTGTHGKTSTTALVYAALKATDADVGVINGGVLQDLQTNAVLPATAEGWLVVEADESDASFTKLTPHIGVITNIEPEHMETYADEAALLAGFQTFADACTQVVTWGGDTRIKQLTFKTVVPYFAEHIVRDGWKTHFHWQGESYTVNAPGNHYAHNAAAALAVVKLIGLDTQRAGVGLANFAGVGRRFTTVGTFKGATVVDDYGHHPTEIEATIGAARGVISTQNGRVIAIVQPHKYTRLSDNWDGFTTCMNGADIAFTLPVYAAGQSETMAGIEGKNSEMLAERAHVNYAKSEAVLRENLSDIVRAGDVILFLGAGDSTAMAARLGKERG